MTLGDFRLLTKDLSDDVVMHIKNGEYEWYGIETMSLKGWTINNADIIYDFGEYEE